MARNKAEKEQARARRKKEARKREEARRTNVRGTRDALLNVLTGSATAAELARVFNNGLSSTPHLADELLDHQIGELRIEVDKYLYAMNAAIAGCCRGEGLIPGAFFGLMSAEDDSSEDDEEAVFCEPMPLALACRGKLTFEPLDDHFKKDAETTAATWIVSTNFNSILGGMLVLALSGNREGARSIHIVRDGKWARLDGFHHVDRFFTKTLMTLMETEQPDAVLLATAVRLNSIAREKRSLEEAVADLDASPEEEIWQGMKPFLERLRFSQFGYHAELMALTQLIAGLRETWSRDAQRLREKTQAAEDLVGALHKRAEAAEKALAAAQREARRQEVRRPPEPAAALVAPDAGGSPIPPLRDRLAEMFR
jgi:hypothetical protein